ncbi:MAG: glycosyltransferase family 39 protein [Bacteroidota bacterium]|nr:glycosyltransferase family 39 protein [Bacteroidota bacterium]
MNFKIEKNIQPFYYQPKVYNWIFVGLLIVVSFVYQYHNIFLLRPQSLHQWRQCDCLSITMNFFKEGMHFFNPSVHCQGAEGGMSGHTISEFPIIYFFVAFLWQLFGHHEWIFRLVEMLIVFTGFFALFKMTEDILKDSLWAIGVVFLLFSSPMLVFYTNNFIANTPALGFALIALYFFWQFYKLKKKKYFYFSLLFYLVAGLIKITSLISFIAILFVFALELFGIYKFKNGNRIFEKPIQYILPFLLLVIAIFSWFYYAHSYNASHGAGFFLIGVLPIWNLDNEIIINIWKSVKSFWADQYFNNSVLIVSAVFLLALIVFFKKINKFFATVTIVIFIGVISYLMLFYKVLAYHDYYLINLLIIIPFIFISVILYLKEKHRQIFNSIFLRIAFFILIGYSISYSAKNIKERYWGWMNNYHEKLYKDLEDITPYLRSLGIERTDKVISLPDGSFNISLYLMDQKGWTDFCGISKSAEQIENKIELGAEYLIITNKKVYEEKYVQPYIKNKIASYKSVDIYELSSSQE